MKVKVDPATGEVVRDLGNASAPDPVPGPGDTASMGAGSAADGDTLENWRAVRFTPPEKIGRFDTSKLPEWLEARLSSADALPVWYGCYSNVCFGAFDEWPMGTFQVAFPTTASNAETGGLAVVGSWERLESKNLWIPGRIESVSTAKLRDTLAKVGSAILHKPNARGNAEWFRVDHHKGLMARLLRMKLSGKPYATKNDEEAAAWAYVNSLRLEETYEALNFSVKTGPQEAVEGDIYAANMMYLLVAPEGMQFSPAMRQWRPVGFGPGSLPNACPPSLVQWTPAIRKTYESILHANDQAYFNDHRSRALTPYEGEGIGEYDGRPTGGTRLLRAPLKVN